MVVDSNVWLSRAQQTETHSAISTRWLRGRAREGATLSVPNLVLAEVAGAIARRTGDPQRGLRAVTMGLLRFPGIQVVPLEESLGLRAMELAARLRIRGSDAVYVALAEALGVPLVTWDTQILARAPNVVTVLQPS